MSSISWGDLFTLLSAVGTIAVAIVAIWGDYLRAKFYPPRLRIEPLNLGGILAPLSDGQKTWTAFYYHLKVINDRPWALAKNCRVMLCGIQRRGADMRFHHEPFYVPRQYVWAPAGFTPVLQTVGAQPLTLDFGVIDAERKIFWPTIYTYDYDFKGLVGPMEAVRYSLRIEADNAPPSKIYVFEVAWDGKWSDEISQMQKSLLIKPISREDVDILH
jgi:hypothetical protein